jgi:hypothetical protein
LGAVATMKLNTDKSKYSFIFFLGLILGVATTVMFNLFPAVLEQKLGSMVNGWNGKILLVDMLVLSAILSWPISNLVNKIGMERSFWISAAIIVVSMISIFVFQSSIVVLLMAIVFAAMFTSLSVSSLPLAIKHANYYEKVFCVGIFFSGVALPDGILEILQVL